MIVRISEAALIGVAGVLMLAVSASARSQAIDFGKIELATQQIASHFYTLIGSPGADRIHPEHAGGRIGLLEGPDGIFMVDAQYAPAASKMLTAIKAINPAPIRFLVNTHGHYDHTGGNAAVAKTGAIVIASEDTRSYLLLPPPPVAAGAGVPPPDPAGLPRLTLGKSALVTIRMDGEVIDIIPLPPAHTGGDIMVRFEVADVIMLGDVYRSYGYPFIDGANGGTVKGMIAAIDMMISIAGPNTQLVPGHGEPVKREALVAYRDMIRTVQDRAQHMIEQGATINQVLAAKLTMAFDAKVPGGLDPTFSGGPNSADRFVGSVYSELSDAKAK